MGSILNIQNPWRNLLKTPASWRRIIFHVETGSRLSGRRTVVHEYPKRDVPYAEDMGQQARRFHFSGYLIYSVTPVLGMQPYVRQREALLTALEQDGPGALIHPVFTFGRSIQCMCERYSMIENRQRGGFTEFEMQFVELGSPGNTAAPTDQKGAVTGNADTVDKGAISNFNDLTSPSGLTNPQSGFNVEVGPPVIGEPTP